MKLAYNQDNGMIIEASLLTPGSKWRNLKTKERSKHLREGLEDPRRYKKGYRIIATEKKTG